MHKSDRHRTLTDGGGATPKNFRPNDHHMLAAAKLCLACARSITVVPPPPMSDMGQKPTLGQPLGMSA